MALKSRLLLSIIRGLSGFAQDLKMSSPECLLNSLGAVFLSASKIAKMSPSSPFLWADVCYYSPYHQCLAPCQAQADQLNYGLRHVLLKFSMNRD